MNKRTPVILLILFTLAGCSQTVDRNPESGLRAIVERGTNIQNFPVGQGQALPPYGLKVVAREAALRLGIITSREEMPGRLQDIQTAIDAVTALAAADAGVTLARISVQSVGGGYDREVSERNIQSLDTGSIVVVLTTGLAGDAANLMEAVATFDAFLRDLTLPETLSVQVQAVETELGDLEPYRSQIIARVYAELDAVQQQYGPEVKYEVTGLYDSLKVMPLSDVAYYIYLEPIIAVSEF